MSSTTRCGESIASAFAISSRLIVLRPARFSGSASSSVSNDCNLEVRAAQRSQVFFEPISRKLGSWERALGIVHILISRQPAVHGLAQQVRHRKLRVLPAP